MMLGLNRFFKHFHRDINGGHSKRRPLTGTPQ
jgi:hypothetical protein